CILSHLQFKAIAFLNVRYILRRGYLLNRHPTGNMLKGKNLAFTYQKDNTNISKKVRLCNTKTVRN
ncbi:MAG: hypothetical protein U9Q87_08540, partial [Pseudomonadota bacterium]|nr:hypothetical protein [Pseudomonadota bacterium]